MMERLAGPSSFALKEPVGWGVTALLCFLLFLFLTFPYGQLQARIVAEISRSTGLEVRATDWSMAPPLSLEWHDVVLAGPAGATPLESLRASIGLLPALAGRVVLDYAIQWPGSAPAGSGKATGSLTAGSWSFQGPLAVKGHLQHIELASIVKPYVSHGTLHGDFSQLLELSRAAPPQFKGNGQWKVEVKDLVLERIQTGTGTMPSLSFSRITASVNCRDATCDVTEIKGDGPDGAFTATGRVLIQQPIQQSQLDLSVTLIPGAGFAQKSTGLGLPPFQPGIQLTIKLAGPIQQPRVVL